MITVFTPTYNRGYIISELYESLTQQTFKNFEWLIVDDGSSDETESIINQFIKENIINIKYKKQKNSGKHVAINNGVSDASGELFFIVDSDDYLSSDALEKLEKRFQDIKHNSEIAGIFINCSSKNLQKKTKAFDLILPEKGLKTTLTNLNHQYKIKGEFATAIKTEIQKAYPYPIFEGEKFCRESLVYRRIGKKYDFLFTSDKIYFADYLEDGLTAKSWKLLKQSPKGASLLFKEMSHEKIYIKEKIIALNYYWDFQINDIKSSWHEKLKGVSLLLSLYVLFCKKFKINIQ